jgi:transcriptional regulator with XRE-family HTH domain
MRVFMQAISVNSKTDGYDAAMRTGRPITKEATSLGQRISAARRDAGLTQQQLADKLGTTQRVVTYWEREAVGLKAEQLTSLADALGISLDKLMGKPQPKARGTGPAGRAKQIFDRVAALPRVQQHSVLDTIEALMAGQAALKNKA